MEISNNYSQNNSYSKTNTQSSSAQTSFGEHMNNSKEDSSKPIQAKTSTEDYIEVNETQEDIEAQFVYTKDLRETDVNDKRGRFLRDIDENYPTMFQDIGISKDDEEIFRSMLFDNKITNEESRNLTFDQSKQLNSLFFDTLGKEGLRFFEFEDISRSIIHSTSFVGDDNFNKALHKTLNNNLSLNFHEMGKIKGELRYNISQRYYEMELGLDDFQAPSKMIMPDVFQKLELDFDSFFPDMLEHLDKVLSKKYDTQTRKQIELIDTNYRDIYKNYQDFKNVENN